jgi:hypothetical protein
MSPDFWIGATIGAFAVICAVAGFMIYSRVWR